MKTETEHLRGLLFDLLAAMTYVRSMSGRFTDEKFDKLEQEVKETLAIKPKQEPPVHRFDPDPAARPSEPPVIEVLYGDMPVHRLCPRCGDVTPKTVHLRKRQLQCQACGETYNFPSVWT